MQRVQLPSLASNRRGEAAVVPRRRLKISSVLCRVAPAVFSTWLFFEGVKCLPRRTQHLDHLESKCTEHLVRWEGVSSCGLEQDTWCTFVFRGGLFWIYNVVGCSYSQMPTTLMTHNRINADLLVCLTKRYFVFISQRFIKKCVVFKTLTKS